MAADSRQVTVRLPEALLVRLEAHRARLAASLPGVGITATAALAHALTMGLDALEPPQPRRKAERKAKP